MNISLVITTHNRLLELAELLESISIQTVIPNEIIIVNDGGASIEELLKLYKELPLKAIELNDNVGHVHARNIGISHVTGNVIMLSDDDDFFTPTHIEVVKQELETADFVYTDAEIVNFERKGNTRFPISRRTFAYHSNLQEMRKFSTYIPSGSAYKKDLHTSIGLFDPEVHNYWDWDFFLRAADICKISRIPIASVIYAFSENGKNQSKDLEGKRKQYLEKLCEKHQLGQLPTKNFFVLLDEPLMKKREAKTQIVWDGKPLKSRLAR